jgi:hypothetical protein
MDDDPQAPRATSQGPNHRRPWYLILALGICFIVGAQGAFSAMYVIDVYREPETDISAQFTDVKNDAEREKLQVAAQGLLDAIQVEEARLFPLSAAELVLGMALFALAVMAMVGRNGARRALVQVMIVYTAVLIAENFATPKFHLAEREANLAQLDVQLTEGGMDPQMVAIQVATQRKLAPFVNPVRLVIRGAIALLVVLALTRRRTHAFYESIAEERNLESGS